MCPRKYLLKITKRHTNLKKNHQRHLIFETFSDLLYTHNKYLRLACTQWYLLEYIVCSVKRETFHSPQSVDTYIYTKFEILYGTACDSPCSAVAGHPSSGERESACLICNTEFRPCEKGTYKS